MAKQKALSRMTAEELGSELTEKQRALVDCLVTTGCSVQEAARAAGYSPNGSDDSVRALGYQTLRKEHVQSYLFRRMTDELNVLGVGALGTLSYLSKSAKSDYVKLEASKDILNRMGLVQADKTSSVPKVEIVFDLSTPGGYETRGGRGVEKPPMPLDPDQHTRNYLEKAPLVEADYTEIDE